MGLARSLRRAGAWGPLSPADFPTAATVIDTWKKVEAFMRDFLSRLRDEDLDRNVEFAIGGTDKRIMPVGELLQHAANHGAHHRGQVSLRLRLLGCNPDNFDLLFYSPRSTLRAS